MKPYDDITLSKAEYQAGWLRAYEGRKDGYLWKEDPIEFLPRYAEQFREEGIQTILDAGCGDGRNTAFLLQKDFYVIGMDISQVAITRALQLVRHRGLNRACFVEADIELLPYPFPENLFDALVCLDTFGQILDVSSLVLGFQRVVRRGGLILVNIYNLDDVSFGEGERLGDRTFLYKNTLYRFFNESDIELLFAGFDLLELKRLRWEDPPHPGYRDYRHEHDSYVVLLCNSR